MELKPTLILTCVAILVAVGCGWRGALAPDPNRGPRLMPWRLMMLLSAALALLLLIHLAHIHDA